MCYTENVELKSNTALASRRYARDRFQSVCSAIRAYPELLEQRRSTESGFLLYGGNVLTQRGTT